MSNKVITTEIDPLLGKHIDVKSLADHWNINRKTVERMCKKGIFEGAFSIGKKFIIPTASVRQYQQNNTLGQPQRA